jgi:putative transposase
MYLPRIPCHVIRRGNNREAGFYTEEDYRFYLERLGSAVKRYRVDIHAYVLMTNHVHLLMTPQTAEGISRVMQSVGRRYVQYINWTYRRSGTLWEGRHKASLVQAANYLFICQRHIEVNPVRARMAEHPGDYRWSSCRANASGSENDLITPHELYRGLAPTADERQRAYRELFCTELDPTQLIG